MGVERVHDDNNELEFVSSKSLLLLLDSIMLHHSDAMCTMTLK